MMKLTELAERVGRLTGRCRETDYLICEAVHPFLAQYGYQRTEGDSGYYSATPSILGAEKVGPASGYTDSLDVAMTLAVKAFAIRIDTGTQQHAADFEWPVVTVWRQSDGREICKVQSVSLPITLSAAWLRARAASESSHG